MAKEKGRVNELEEALVYVALQDGRAVECVIDTGFNGWLSFPNTLVEELQLPIIGREKISVLGTRKLSCPIASARIVWLGRTLNVNVIVNDGADVLLGTQLLSGAILRVNYHNHRLTITKPELKSRN
jgi:clan AA aspartic protease